MMDASYVDAIAALGAKAQEGEEKTVIIDGETFSTVQLHHVRTPKVPEPAALVVHTLTGFADYIQANRDELTLEELVVHVEGPGVVSLRSRLEGEHHQRFTYLRAENLNRFAAVPSFGFGRYLPLADFRIALMALFEESQVRGELLQVLGTVKVEEGVQQDDDGVSQSVQAKRGIRLVENVRVPSPAELYPYRTFPEVFQPGSPFIIRLQEKGAGVEAAMFEADGGAWQLQTIKDTAAWLREKLPAEIAVIA